MDEKRKYFGLRKEFIDLYTKKIYLIYYEMPSIAVLHTNLIGRSEYCVFSVELFLKQMELRLIMAKACVRKGEKPDAEKIEQRSKFLKHWFVQEERELLKEQDTADNYTETSAEVIENCNFIYRMLVDHLHSDLHPSLSNSKREMMLLAEDAYQHHDVNELCRLATEYYCLEDGITEPEVDYQLCNILLESRIKDLREEIQSYENSFPLNYIDRLHDPDWVSEQEKMMSENAKRMVKEVKRLYKEFRLLTEQ